MLRKYPAQLRTLDSRQNREEWRQHWQTARASTSIPGLGHEFWQTARAHLDADAVSIAQRFSLPQYSATEAVDENTATQLLLELLAQTDSQGDRHSLQLPPRKVWVGDEVCWFVQTQGPDDRDSTIATNIELFHGTRDYLLSRILRAGLRPSEKSHGQIGLWCNRSCKRALDWNTTIIVLTDSMAPHAC